MNTIEKPPGEQANFELRNQTSTALYKSNWDFRRLSWIRNALAHGSKPINEATIKLLGARQLLEQALRDVLRTLRQ
ncbi:hypothetical protein [Thiospirillum jenense]|uniref:hypothetical protein n=1 Tax=Thiospirillum jenense TaxID=1653858 RepID=UPI001EECA006|nr:hypothetical protein [Thiospirillum jenense]